LPPLTSSAPNPVKLFGLNKARPFYNGALFSRVYWNGAAFAKMMSRLTLKRFYKIGSSCQG
jgi:hypothetical protein